MSAEATRHTPGERLARAAYRIFQTADGALLRRHLEVDVLGSLSAIDPNGDLVSHDQMLLAEGQKLLAKKLIGLADGVTRDGD